MYRSLDLFYNKDDVPPLKRARREEVKKSYMEITLKLSDAFYFFRLLRK